MAPIKFKSLKTFNKGKSEFRFNDNQESRFGTRVVFLKISCCSKVLYTYFIWLCRYPKPGYHVKKL